ncbi:unnamed protein product [Ixodes pacificus]
MPYVGKKRQWERKMEAMQQQPDPESFPALRAPSVERPRGESRQRDSGRKRDHSKRGRSEQPPQTVAVEGESHLGRRSHGKHGREETNTGAKRREEDPRKERGGESPERREQEAKAENRRTGRNHQGNQREANDINRKIAATAAAAAAEARTREETRRDDRGRTRGRGGPEKHEGGGTGSQEESHRGHQGTKDNGENRKTGRQTRTS